MKATIFALLFALSSSTLADEVIVTFNGGSLSCNWGELTANDAGTMGTHASDPSGDGTGPGDVDSPRVGLANVINKGDLEATCDFIRSLLGN